MICHCSDGYSFFNLKGLGPLNIKNVSQRLNKLVKGACLDNVASAANCVVAERYFRYPCDRGMWRYGITYSGCSAPLQIDPCLWH
jgi:hypothetical protein